MSTTDIYGEEQWQDGRDVLDTDLNAMQRRTIARLFDQVIASKAPNYLADIASNDPEFTSKLGANMPTGPYAYALNAGGANLVQGSAHNKLKIAAGTLLQKIANADGTEAKLLAYTFPGTDEVTIANGDATNPRVDLVQMQLAYVDADPTSRDFEDAVTGAPSTASANITRRVQCTLTVKQGTPAASPTYPAPDAGCVVIAGVVVGATYAAAADFVYEDTAGAVAVVHDQRMPLGVRPFSSMPSSFIYASGVDFSPVGNGTLVQAVSGAGHGIVIPVNTGSEVGRVIGHDIALYDADIVNGHYVKRSLTDAGGGTGVAISNTNLQNSYANGSSSLTFARRAASFANLQANHTPAAGPTVLPAANGMGAPLWTNGKRAALARSGTFPIPYESLALSLTASGGVQIGPVTFYVAMGL